MIILVDQDIGLDKKNVRRRDSDWRSKSYPLQIPMYHPLAVHIYQSSSDIFELSRTISSTMGAVSSKNETLQAQTDSHPYAP